MTGGTPPYTYEWSTGSTAEDVFDLRAGFISVVVRDAQNAEAREERTLTEPHALIVDAAPYVYGSGHHVSCYNCYNGSIAVTVGDGVAPYNYAWVDGPTTEDRTQLDAGTYEVHVTDANGCLEKSGALSLTQPERDDWSRAGNAGTDPVTQFIGTTDNKDVVLKSNGSEALRLKSNGDIRIGGSLTNFGLLWRDDNGILRGGPPPNYPPIPTPPGIPCWDLATFFPLWRVDGNSFPEVCAETPPLLGTLDETPVRIITNGEHRILITPEGRVGIGTEPSAEAVDGYRLFVEDGVVCRDVLVKHGDWPDFVFAKDYHLRSLGELRGYLKEHAHLPALPSAAELDNQGGMAVGDIVRGLTRTAEEQALYILQLEEKLERMEQRLQALETSQH